MNRILLYFLLLPICFALVLPTRVSAQAEGPFEVTVNANEISGFTPPRELLQEITREQIEAQNVSTLSQLLNSLAPMYIDPSSSGSFVYLRGAESNYTIVYIDGVPLNDPTDSRGGTTDLGRISIDELERVEILGATSAAFMGQGALAGAINIVTRRFRDRKSSFEVSRARNEKFAGSARLNTSAENKAISFALYGNNGEEILEDNERSRRGAELRGEYVLGPRLLSRVGVRVGNVRQHAFAEDSGGAEFAVLREKTDREQDEVLVSADLRGTLGESTEFLTQYSHLFINSDEFSPAVLAGLRDPFGIPGTDTNNRLQRDQVLVRASPRIREDVQFDLGLDTSLERSSSESLIFFGEDAVPADFELDRHYIGGIAALRYSISEDFEVSAGSRYDQFEGYDGELEPLAKLRYVSWEQEFWIGYSEASKAPSIYALSHPIVGDPGLDLEKSRVVEGGVKGRILATDYRISLHHSQYFDPIDLDEGPPPRLVNRDEIAAYGSELSVTRALSADTSCTAHGSFNYFDIVDSDEKLRNRPRWRSGASCRSKLDAALSASASFYFVGSREDSSIPTGDKTLGSYMQTDIGAAYEFSPGLILRFTLENVFNDQHQEQIGERALGVVPKLGIEGRL